MGELCGGAAGALHQAPLFMSPMTLRESVDLAVSFSRGLPAGGCCQPGRAQPSPVSGHGRCLGVLGLVCVIPAFSPLPRAARKSHPPKTQLRRRSHSPAACSRSAQPGHTGACRIPVH